MRGRGEPEPERALRGAVAAFRGELGLRDGGLEHALGATLGELAAGR